MPQDPLLGNDAAIASALTAVGELLAADGEAYAIVIIGGATLILMRIVRRATRDIDMLAWKKGDVLIRPPKPLPAPLERAIAAVAERFGLPTTWLNTGPASQWDTGLPPGLADRVHWTDYAALSVGLVDRYDLVFFKAYAAADNGPRDNHYRDLLALRPTHEELAAAIAWAQTQDPSPAFRAAIENMSRQLTHDLPPDAA
jgi:Nucleotidyltransferase of unknown function (DUF6036)